MRIILTMAFGVSLISSLLLTALVKRFAPRLGLMDHPGGRKEHVRPMAHGGGIAICLSACATILLIGLAVMARSLIAAVLPLSEGLLVDLTRARSTLPFLLYLTGGGVLVALLGLLDDIRPLPPAAKILGQILIVSAAVLASGLRITLFLPFEWIQVLITVFWIMLLTNSFNLLDNMDGLSASVATVCGFSLLICTLATQQYFIAGFLLCLLGACLGFLFFNFPPASLFMGDSGSMFIGYMLAVAGVLTTFFGNAETHWMKPILLPLILFALPLYDTCSVILIRFLRKKPIFEGDRNHFSHRLLRGGMSPKKVLLTVVLITLATSIGATVPYMRNAWLLIIPTIQVACIVVVLVQLEMWNN